MPDRPAIVTADRELSWSEINTRINRLASGMLAIGIRPGDRVAFMLKNSHEWFEAQAACGKTGIAVVFVSYRYTPAEVEYLVGNSDARALVFHADFRAVVTKACDAFGLPDDALIEIGGPPGSTFRSYADLLAHGHEGEPDSELRSGGSRLILYTSGTTGQPKGAVRDLARGGIGTILNLLSVVPFRRSDRHLVAAPLYHATGSGFAMIHVSLGATLHVMEYFDPITFLETVDREKITTTALVPTMLRRVLEILANKCPRYDLSSLRVIICTGSPLNPRLKEQAREVLGPVVYDLYGATEMGWVTVATPDDQVNKPASVGKVVTGTEVVLLSEQRAPVPDGEIGELFAKNDLTIEGYHANEEATEESRWSGYFSVGDLAIRDDEGFITLVDRKTDMVISGGMNIYPAEIEALLMTHPSVFEAAVIGVPTRNGGNRSSPLSSPGKVRASATRS